MPMETYPRPAKTHDQAHQLWLILTGWATFKCEGKTKRPGIITYGEAAVLMGYPPNAGRTLARPLGMISKFCGQNDLPRLNSIVVDFETGQPGDGIPEDFVGSIADMQKAVNQFSWFNVIPPTRRVFRETGY